MAPSAYLGFGNGMSDTPAEREFSRAVEELADDRLDVIGLIGTAETINTMGRPDLAVRLYRLGLRCFPATHLLHVLHYNYGMTLAVLGDADGATAALEQAISVSPEFQPARLNLGNQYIKAGRAAEATQVWNESIEQLSGVTRDNLRYKKLAYSYIAYHAERGCRYDEAEAALLQSLLLDERQDDLAQQWFAFRQEQCAWPLIDERAPLPRETFMRLAMPLSLAAYTDDPVLQLAAGWKFGCAHRPPEPPLLPVQPEPRRAEGRRLRIGYFSSDLRSHAVGYLMPQVFERHDRSKFEIIAYYHGATGFDALGNRLRAAVDQWVELTDVDHATAARRMLADEVDILVDLNGYTRDARTQVLAMRPAPVIVNWLGYPGTMATPYHHYIVADDWIIPKSHEAFYSEKVLRLPCYQPNDTARVAAPPKTRAELGLPDDVMVYCCFNSSHKITRFVFERWLAILEQVPDSVLWLLMVHDGTRENLHRAAAARGIAPERLIFAPKIANPDHLARYHLADLFLDTAPYGAHTTASDALWMGLPVLTQSGGSFASRVCGSLVRAAGLPELVCTSPAEYVERAVRLGRDRAELERLRERLIAGRDTCTLFDMDGLVRGLEGLYEQMWQEQLAGTLPVPDLTNLDAYLDVGVREDFDARDSMEPHDVAARYRQGLAALHHERPLPKDRRLWRARDIRAAGFA